MEYVIRPAPDGVKAAWFIDHDEDLLVILMADNLDEVKRQRFITEAKRENGIATERHRRIAIPFILPAGGRHAGTQRNAVVVGVAAAAVAVAATAAVMGPVALHSGSDPAHHQPARAAAPPSRPGPSSGPGSGQPTGPGSPPARPAPSNTASPDRPDAPAKQAPRPARHGHDKPSTGHPPTLPSLPVDLPPSAEPPGPIAAATPGPRQGLCIRIDLGIKARIGCRKR